MLVFALMLCYLAAAETLSLYFTNDTHGAYLPRVIKTPAGMDSIGGYANLYKDLTKRWDFDLQDDRPHLWLDAGDEQTGSVFTAYKYQGTTGGAVVETFNMMGLDAATFGNHEFDQSLLNTQQLVKLAKYPFVSANIVWKKTGKPFTGKPYVILKKGTLKIGVLGLTMTDLNEKVKAENVSKLKVLPYKQAVNKYLKELDKKTDVIILLTHIGMEADSLLATQLDNRVDIIVGGHSHTEIPKPLYVNGILILQTGSYLTNQGSVILNVDQDRVTLEDNLTNVISPLLASQIAGRDNFFVMTPDFANSGTSIATIHNKKARDKLRASRIPLSKFLDDISAQISKDMDKVIGMIPEDWIPHKYMETTVSCWQAQALLAEYKDQYQADIAMLNCGGIRKAIPAGEVTLREMTEMLPFNNYIVVFSCIGADLLKFWEINEQHKISKPYDIVQSTMTGWYKTDLKDSDTFPQKRDWFDLGNGQKVDENKIYRVVTHDYLAGQWDKYLGFKPFGVSETGDLIYDVMVKQVERQYGRKKSLTK